MQEYPILEDSKDSPRGTTSHDESLRLLNGEVAHCATILFLNATQNLTDLLKDRFALKSDDAFTVDSALSKIKKALTDRKRCGCPPYSHFIIDQEREVNLSMLRQVAAKVKDLQALRRNGEVGKMGISLVVLGGRNSPEETLENLKAECLKLEMTFEIKPEMDKQDEALETFMRIMKSSGDKES